MRVKDIRNAIRDLPDDMKVIVIGEYDYGVDLPRAFVKDMVFDGIA
jgi:hypothetical protein